MELSYYLVNVFTEVSFPGNSLAVFPDATGVDTGTMQRIAREPEPVRNDLHISGKVGRPSDARTHLFTGLRTAVRG